MFSVVSLNLETSSLMSCKTDSSVSKTHPMKSEHSIRHPVDEETYSSHKVESKSGVSKSFVYTDDKRVRNQVQSQITFFVSQLLDYQAVEVDVMQVNWDRKSLYALPPFTLVPHVIDKLLLIQNLEMLLVASLWR